MRAVFLCFALLFTIRKDDLAGYFRSTVLLLITFEAESGSMRREVGTQRRKFAWEFKIEAVRLVKGTLRVDLVAGTGSGCSRERSKNRPRSLAVWKPALY